MSLWKKIKQDWPQKILLTTALTVTCFTIVLMRADMEDRGVPPFTSDVIISVQFDKGISNKYAILANIDPKIEIIYEDSDTKIIRVKTKNPAEFLKRLLSIEGINDAKIK